MGWQGLGHGANTAWWNIPFGWGWKTRAEGPVVPWKKLLREGGWGSWGTSPKARKGIPEYLEAQEDGGHDSYPWGGG